MKEYYQEYELLIDLPTGEKKGSRFFKTTQNGNVCFRVGELSKFTTRPNQWFQKHSDYKDDLVLTLEQMTPEFFKPIGKSYPLYPKFPPKKKIKEFCNVVGETRLVDDVDEARCIGKILYSDEFYDKVYELLKQMYNDKFFKEDG